MEPDETRRAALRFGSYGAALALGGALLSGPVALFVVNATHPQPPWRGPRAFVESYHAVQALPFFLGFALVGGFVVLLAALQVLASGEERARATVALALGATFAAMIFTNYVLQTTFVPALVRDDTSRNDALLASVTMANPRSLGWALEMWGYGVLGVATWLAAPVLRGAGIARAARIAFVANGPASVVPAVLTAFDPGWELGGLGLVSFGLWNLLVVAMTVLALVWFGRLRRAAVSESTGERSPAALTTAGQ